MDEDTVVKGIQAWEKAQTSGSAPCGRCWAGSCVVDNQFYVFGGYNGKQEINAFLSDFHILNLDTLEWREVIAYGELPPARYAHSLTAVGKKIYCFGGAAGRYYFNSLHIYDTETNVWERAPVIGTVPVQRCAHSAVRVGKFIYIFGGDHGMGQYLDDLFLLDTETLQFFAGDEKLSEKPPSRGWHSCCAIETKLYLFGGCNESQRPPLFNDMWILHTDTLVWECCNFKKLPVARYSHTATAVGTEIAVVGGKNKDSVIGDVDWFSTDLMVWWEPNISSECSPPKNRYAHCSALYKNRIFVFGGNSGETTFNDLFVLDFDPQHKGTSRLSQDLSILLESKNFTDVTFIVEDRKIPAHRNILASRCKYFYNMFLSNLRESAQQEITISDQTYNVFMALLRYTYTEKLDETNVDEALDLLPVANIYQFDSLKEDLSNLLKRYLVVENACRLFQHAHYNGCTDLERECLEFIAKNFPVVKKTKYFSELDKELLEFIKSQRELPL